MADKCIHDKYKELVKLEDEVERAEGNYRAAQRGFISGTIRPERVDYVVEKKDAFKAAEKKLEEARKEYKEALKKEKE